MFKLAIFIAALLLAAATVPVHAVVVYSASGVAPASIQATVDSFRAALGSLNPNSIAFFPGGRREINWDGVPDASAAPNALPSNFFNVTSPRGVVFSTGGTGFQVSARASSGTAVLFGNINSAYLSQFQTFSAERLFTAIGSNAVQIDFFVPGTTIDVDGNGTADALTDGLLILRYLFGLRGASLITGAFDPAGSRKTAETIEPYINSLLP